LPNLEGPSSSLWVANEQLGEFVLGGF